MYVIGHEKPELSIFDALHNPYLEQDWRRLGYKTILDFIDANRLHDSSLIFSADPTTKYMVEDRENSDRPHFKFISKAEALTGGSLYLMLQKYF